MVISQGLGGPKGKPKGVPDGQSVNIPTLPHISLEVTEFSSSGELSDSRFLLEDFSRVERKPRFFWVNPNEQTSQKSLFEFII